MKLWMSPIQLISIFFSSRVEFRHFNQEKKIYLFSCCLKFGALKYPNRFRQLQCVLYIYSCYGIETFVNLFFCPLFLSFPVIYCNWLNFNHVIFIGCEKNTETNETSYGRRIINARCCSWNHIGWNGYEKKNRLELMKLEMRRAIVTAWVVIVTTGIPAALSHGVVNYPYNDRNYTACLFLSEQGYNLVAFQVNIITP